MSILSRNYDKINKKDRIDKFKNIFHKKYFLKRLDKKHNNVYNRLL